MAPSIDESLKKVEEAIFSIDNEELIKNESYSLVQPYVEYVEVINVKTPPHEVPISQLASIVRKIVEVEGPINEREVGRRVARVFGLEKAGSRIQDAASRALNNAGLQDNSGFWSLKNAKVEVIRDRSNVTIKSLQAAENLPPEELLFAIRYIVKSSVRVHVDELIQSTSRILGFSRCGPEIKGAIEKVLNLDNDLIRDENSFYSC